MIFHETMFKDNKARIIGTKRHHEPIILHQRYHTFAATAAAATKTQTISTLHKSPKEMKNSCDPMEACTNNLMPKKEDLNVLPRVAV